MSQAKLISEIFVRPEFELDESKRVHHLNPFDLIMLLLDYAPMGFLYTKPCNFTPSSYLEHLRWSLSRALVHFYPLAGRLVSVPNQSDHSCYIYVDCTKGPGARFIYASAPDVTMSHVLSPDSDFGKVVRSFFDLGEVSINYDGHTRPLLSVQVTELDDGVFFGICFNHSVVDGVSLYHFQRVWSHIFMGTFSPSICLPIIKQPESIFGRGVINLPYLDPDEFVIRPTTEGHLMGRFFRFSPQSLRKIKAIANSDSNVKSGGPISTFKSIIAFVWKCITRARNLNPDDLTTCGLPVNLRPRFNPPLSDDYFGNYAIKAMVHVKVGDLLCNSVGWAATLLNSTVEAQDDTSARGIIKRAMDMGPEIVTPAQTRATSNNNVIVGSSPRFNLLESRFGLGRLIGFRGGYGNKADGKVNAYMGVEGDGSVDLDIRLVPQTMAALLLDREFMSFVSPDNTDQ